MDRPFKFNGVPVKTPDTFKPDMATTSTDDSDRTQDLVMHNSPIGTVERYSFEWKNIEPKEAAAIVNHVKNKKRYSLRYLRADSGEWAVGDFYTSNYTFGSLVIVNGDYAWESLSFNAVGVYPI